MIPHLWIVSRLAAPARICLSPAREPGLAVSGAGCSCMQFVSSKPCIWIHWDGSRNSRYGRTYPARSAVTKERIFVLSWKNWPASKNPRFQSLDLRTENGQKQALSAEMDGALRGELSTLNFGECPSVAVESRLSWILEDNVPEKYYLSARACQGILNRASRRGKELPKNPARGTSGNDRVVESTGFTNRGRYSGVVSETLRAESHGAIPMICAAFTAGQGAKANGIGYAEEQAPTLRADGGLSAMPTVLCRAHGQANAETLEDCAPTLNCNHEQPIVFEIHSQDARYTQQGDTSPGGVAYQEVLTLRNDTVANALMARDYKGVGRADSLGKAVAVKTPLRWIVRRLTPTEGERLQGFPDGWTDIGEWVDSKGKRHKAADSPRYKALGNSIALPQWWWIVCKMAQYLPDRATLGSLFDGIGGFPLVWETLHGKGSAVWASEIEEFPIAVTKRRFPEEGEKSDDL